MKAKLRPAFFVIPAKAGIESRLRDLADPELAELAVEGRAADPETARDLGHAAAIMADGEADHVGLDLLERAHVAVMVVERDARALGQRRGAGGAVQRLAMIVAGAAAERRFLRDLREVGRGQRIVVAEHGGAEQGVLEL